MEGTEKPRVLYIGLIPPTRGGRVICGAAIHGWELARKAFENGYDVYFIADVLGKQSQVEEEGIKIIKMPHNRLKKAISGIVALLFLNHKSRLLHEFRLREKIAILARYFFLKKVIKAIKPQLIHVHGENTWSLSLRILASSIPIIISNHGHLKNVEKRDDIARMKKIIGSADFLIFVSKHLKNEEIRIINDYKGKIFFINNPIDPEKIPFMDKTSARKELNLIGAKKIILFSGICNSLKLKRLDLLLKAINGNEKLKKTTITIVISDEEGIKFANEYAKQNHMDCRILGSQTWDMIIKMYNSADVFVLPSQSEAFPLVFLESLLAGVPVVGYSNAVEEIEKLLKTYIGEKYDANTESIDTLGYKINKAIRRKIDRRKTRDKVINQLSWQRRFCEYDKVYKRAIFRAGNSD